MAGNTWIFFLACAFSLAFACLLFLAMYSRTVELFEPPSYSLPVCNEADRLGSTATLGGDGNIYITRNDDLVCVVPQVPVSAQQTAEGTPTHPSYIPTAITTSINPPHCTNFFSQKRKAGDGRLWGVENEMPCVY